jgi:hypothetical protein
MEVKIISARKKIKVKNYILLQKYRFMKNHDQIERKVLLDNKIFEHHLKM